MRANTRQLRSSTDFRLEETKSRSERGAHDPRVSTATGVVWIFVEGEWVPALKIQKLEEREPVVLSTADPPFCIFESAEPSDRAAITFSPYSPIDMNKGGWLVRISFKA
mgnify:FL=1